MYFALVELPLLLRGLGSFADLVGGLLRARSQLGCNLLAQSFLFVQSLVNWLIRPFASSQDPGDLVYFGFLSALRILEVYVKLLLRQVYQSLVEVHFVYLTFKLIWNRPFHAVDLLLAVV